jgi:hypothetical protein
VVGSEVGGHFVGIVGEDHRVLVDVDHDQVIHQTLVAELLLGIEWNPHGGDAADLGGELELRRWHDIGV